VCSQLWLRLVVCIRDGASCSGLVCTLSYVLERLKVEHDIDIFHSVRHARINRLQIIPVFVSLLFFHFCMLCQCCLTNFSALLFHAKLACSLASPGQIGLPYGFHSPLVSIGNILFFQICLFLSSCQHLHVFLSLSYAYCLHIKHFLLSVTRY